MMRKTIRTLSATQPLSASKFARFRDGLRRPSACSALCDSLFRLARLWSRICYRYYIPISFGRRQHDFLNAYSSSLPPSCGSLKIAKYKCAVNHWQSLLSKYSTAQNTSYRSTHWRLVFYARFLESTEWLQIVRCWCHLSSFFSPQQHLIYNPKLRLWTGSKIRKTSRLVNSILAQIFLCRIYEQNTA